MKTNIMIRIDETVAQNAKSLDLNISKVCEDALARVVQEEARPYEIIESFQVIFDLNLFCDKTQNKLGLIINITNATEENVIFDRLTYTIYIQPARQNGMTDPISQIINGAILERMTIRKGQKTSFVESVSRTFEPTKITGIPDETLTYRIFPQLFVDSKRGTLRCKFEQKLDEHGLGIAHPLNVFSP